jgi:gluconolactonase
MKSSIVFAIVACMVGSAVVPAQVGAQEVRPGEREWMVAPIPGVVAGGAEWKLVWDGFDNADGIIGAPDGSLLFAQEQPSRVRRLAPDDSTSVYLEDTGHAGSIALDSEGRLLAVQRGCTDPGRPAEIECSVAPKLSILAPAYKVLADGFSNGESFGRLNDLVVDRKGGAYFTVGGAYYASPDGEVITVATREEIRSNGITLSRDEQTLYVTNREIVVAFDVQADGSVRNRRDFATLVGDGGGDGMAIDSEDRVYVTGNMGVHVLSPTGEHLGMIPTPRRPITVAFAGPEKKTLYIVGSGAVDVFRERNFEPPEGVRNNSKTIYKISMLAEGFQGRAK